MRSAFLDIPPHQRTMRAKLCPLGGMEQHGRGELLPA